LKYKLFYQPAVALTEAPCNAGIGEALGRAEELRQRGVPLEMIDTTQMAPDALQREYINAIAASVVKKYRVRQVFGSRRHSGWLFGRGVPALVVVGSSGYAEDVYPHDSAGRYVTIAEFLANLAHGLGADGSQKEATRRAGRKAGR